VIGSGQKQYGPGRNGWTTPTVKKILKKYDQKSPHAPARETDLAGNYHLRSARESAWGGVFRWFWLGFGRGGFPSLVVVLVFAQHHRKKKE